MRWGTGAHATTVGLPARSEINLKKSHLLSKARTLLEWGSSHAVGMLASWLVFEKTTGDGKAEQRVLGIISLGLLLLTVTKQGSFTHSLC